MKRGAMCMRVCVRKWWRQRSTNCAPSCPTSLSAVGLCASQTSRHYNSRVRHCGLLSVVQMLVL